MIAKIKLDSLELKDSEKFITFDIGLAAAMITLGYTLWDVDKTNPKKSIFIFRRDDHTDKMVNQYWEDTLNVPARSLLDNQKMLKNRLYSV